MAPAARLGAATCRNLPCTPDPPERVWAGWARILLALSRIEAGREDVPQDELRLPSQSTAHEPLDHPGPQAGNSFPTYGEASATTRRNSLELCSD